MNEGYMDISDDWPNVVSNGFTGTISPDWDV